MRLFLTTIVFCMLSACSGFKPQALDYAKVDIPADQWSIDYGVYTPPNWQPIERLPVVIMLHGGGGSHVSFERYGAHEYLNRQISAGKISRAIIVTPNGQNGFWENWHDGTRHYRDWVLDHVLPQVMADYNTLTCPEHCHLAGISMGGFGVLRFAYFANDRFSSVSAISAPIFSKAQAEKQKTSWLVKLLFPFKRIFGEHYTEEFRRSNPYNAFVEDENVQKMRLQLIWGDKDHARIKQSNEAFHKHLAANDVKHDYYVYQGGHRWKYWVPNLDRVMNFLLVEQDQQTSAAE